jgi:type II secretory pathway component PulF
MGAVTRVSQREVAVFMRLFATMIGAGLPLLQSLDILARQTDRGSFRKVVRRLIYDVESGDTLAGAMGRHPKVFSELSVNMVAAGEAAGALDTVLVRLAEFLEKNSALGRKIRTAMVYPAMIVGVAVPTVAILLVFVIPTFQTMFASSGVPLPLPTRIVIGASEIVKSSWWMLLIAGAACLVALGRARRTDRGRLLADRLLLSIPVLGNLLRKAAVARFTRTLGTLVHNAVPLVQALGIVREISGNRVIAQAIRTVAEGVKRGEGVALPMRRAQVFPPLAVHLVEVGEETGRLDVMLLRLAEVYDKDVRSAVKNFIALFEPVMILFMGVVVGAIVISMLLAIVSINEVPI